jgi:Ca2+/Na+ antiporter
MPAIANFGAGGSGRVLLLVGAVFMYIASRAAAGLLAGGGDSSGLRAVGHWIPIAAAALIAAGLKRPDLALSIIFATSVATLSLVLGSVVIISPTSDAHAALRRMWPFVLPAALLTLLAGLAGELNWVDALILLVEGVVLLSVWRGIDEGSSAGVALEAREGEGAKRRREPGALNRANLILCIGVAIVGAFAGVAGVVALSREFSQLSELSPVVALLAPILVLPMLSGGAALANDSRANVATTTGVGVVMLNLCLLLPVIILLRRPIQSLHRNLDGKFPIRFDLFTGNSSLVFSWVTWRVDNVVLLVLAFVLIPAALGRWRLGRAEGVTLIGVYAVYVIMEAAAGMRM